MYITCSDIQLKKPNSVYPIKLIQQINTTHLIFIIYMTLNCLNLFPRSLTLHHIIIGLSCSLSIGKSKSKCSADVFKSWELDRCFFSWSSCHAFSTFWQKLTRCQQVSIQAAKQPAHHLSLPDCTKKQYCLATDWIMNLLLIFLGWWSNGFNHNVITPLINDFRIVFYSVPLHSEIYSSFIVNWTVGLIARCI